MKKKNGKLAIAGIALLSALCGVAIAGCGGAKNEHTLTLMEAEDPTCTQDGHSAYYSCSHCDLIFADAEAKEQVTLDSVKIEKRGHDLHHEDPKDATCTEDGQTEHYACSRCDATFIDAQGATPTSKSPIIGSLGHQTMSHTEAKEPTLEADGNVEYYTCPRCEDNFADEFGDREIKDVVIPKIAEVGAVSIAVKGYKDGEEVVFANGTEVSIAGKFEQSATVQISGGKAAFTKVYGMEYAVTCGDYTGKITFEEGKTDYTLRLEYPFATGASSSDTGKSTVDLSAMNEKNHTITMSDVPSVSGLTRNFTEVTLNLPDEVKQAKATTVSFTVKHNSDELHSLTRFGVKMADGKGIALFTNDMKSLQVYAFGRGFANGGIFDGYDNGNAKYAGAVTSAYHGEGLQVRMVRINGYIRMYVKLGNAWTELIQLDVDKKTGNKPGVATCNPDAETDIRFLICSDEWEFSNIEFGVLDYEEEHMVSDTVPEGNFENYSFTYGSEKMYFSPNATLMSESDVKIFRLESAYLYLGNRDSERFAAGTEITLTNDAVGTVCAVTDQDGRVTLTGTTAVYSMVYRLQVKGHEGYVEVTFRNDQDTYECAFVATNTGVSGTGSSVVDLSQILDSSITLSDAETWGVGNVTGHYTEATLVLPEEVKQAKNVAVTFNLKYNTDNTFGALARFGVQMTNKKGVFVTVYGGDDEDRDYMEVCPLWNTSDNVFNGVDGAKADYARIKDARYVKNMLKTSGLNVMVVRATDRIRIFIEIENAWVEFSNSYTGAVTCDADAETDIRFLILSYSWTFSDFQYDILDSVAETPASALQAGKRAHLKYSQKNILFTTDGRLGTDTLLTLPYEEEIADPVTITVKGRKDGIESLLNGEITLTNAYDSKYAIAEMVLNGVATLDLADAKLYALTYAVECGDYYGVLEVQEGTNEYTLVLEYRYATSTGISSGNWQIDFSHMNDADHTITTNAENGLATANYTEAKLNLPDEVKNSVNTTVSFNLKFKNSFGAHMRFGVKMAGDTGVFVTCFEDRIEVCKINANYYDTFSGWDNANIGYAAALQAKLKGDGMQVRMVRTGSTIRMYVVLDMGEGDEWIELVSVYGVVTCGANAETDIRLLSLSGEWTFSNIEYGTLTKVSQSPTTSADGLETHFTYGSDDNKLYFNTDGTMTTLEALKIPKLEAQAIAGSVTVYDENGVAVSIPESLVLTLVYDKAGIDLVYENVSVVNGKFSLAEVAKGDYTVMAEGYANVKFTTKDGEIVLNLYPEFAEDANPNDTAHVEGYVTGDKKVLSVTEQVVGWDVSCLGENMGVAKLILTEAQKQMKAFTLYGTLKLSENTNSRPLVRGGIWITGAEKKGFMFTCMDDNPLLQDGENGLNEGSQKVGVAELSHANLHGGLEICIIRDGGKLAFAVRRNGSWVNLLTVDCGADAENEIRLLGSSGRWELSDLRMEAMEAVENATLTLTGVAENTKVTLEGKYVPGSFEGMVGADGAVTFASGIYKNMEYVIKVDGYFNGEVTFTTASATVALEKSGVSIKAENIDASKGNVVFDFDGAELNGREILAYQRYGDKNMVEKDENNILGNDGLLTLTGRYGGDYNGDTTSIQFTAGGKTDGSCGFLGNDNPAASYVTIGIGKDVTQLVFFTGTYHAGSFPIEIYDKATDTLLQSYIYGGLVGGTTRGQMIVIDIDTSVLLAGSADETKTVELRVNGADLEFAGLVVLGAEANG